MIYKYLESETMPTKLKQMRNKVLEELEHIPKRPYPQGELRSYYWGMRMHSLSDKTLDKKTAKEVLQDGISFLKKDYPDFEFSYDQEFFRKN